MIKQKSDRLKLIGVIALLLVMVLTPLVASSFIITMFIRYMYYGLLTISFAFLASQLGLFSLMVPVSLTICGYIIGLGVLRANMNVWLAVALGILGSQSFAALCGMMVNKSKGTSFLMLTLVISQLVWSLSLQWTSVTNGTTGLLDIRFPEYLNIFSTQANINQYYWTFIVFAICVVFVFLLTRSSFGLRLQGVRDSESRMAALGYKTSTLKWVAFMVANLISAIAGVLYVYNNGMITPDVMTMSSTNKSLISSILGGSSSPLLGSMIGTVIYRTFDVTLSAISRRYLTLVGSLFLLVILVLPDGITSIAKRIGRRGKKHE